MGFEVSSSIFRKTRLVKLLQEIRFDLEGGEVAVQHEGFQELEPELERPTVRLRVEKLPRTHNKVSPCKVAFQPPSLALLGIFPRDQA